MIVAAYTLDIQRILNPKLADPKTAAILAKPSGGPDPNNQHAPVDNIGNDLLLRLLYHYPSCWVTLVYTKEKGAWMLRIPHPPTAYPQAAALDGCDGTKALFEGKPYQASGVSFFDAYSWEPKALAVASLVDSKFAIWTPELSGVFENRGNLIVPFDLNIIKPHPFTIAVLDRQF